MGVKIPLMFSSSPIPTAQNNDVSTQTIPVGIEPKTLICVITGFTSLVLKVLVTHPVIMTNLTVPQTCSHDEVI